MSREHLYKAKRVNWRELPKEEWWVEGAVLQSETETRIATSFFSSGEVEEAVMVASYLVDPETVCECTGLTEKNGKKIWENNIVNCREYECCGYIAWNEEESGFYFLVLLEDGRYEEELLYDYVEELEIIGNTFDNPEFLEGGEAE